MAGTGPFELPVDNGNKPGNLATKWNEEKCLEELGPV